MSRRGDAVRRLGAPRACRGIQRACHAEEHAPSFVAAGIPPDFAEMMRAEARAFRDAVDARAHELGRRAAATAGLASEVMRGRQVLSAVESMVSGSVERDAVLAAEWKDVLRGRGARQLREG